MSRDPERDWARIAPHALYDAQTYASWQPAGQRSAMHVDALTPDEVRKSGVYRVVTPDECVQLANETGRVIPQLKSRESEFGPDDFIVVCDDIALPVGAIRIRAKGSSGGHNGLKSVEAALGSNEYARMRLGVGGPGAAANPDYVLAKFGTQDMKVVEETVATAVEALKCWAADGVEKAMTRFNRVDPQED